MDLPEILRLNLNYDQKKTRLPVNDERKIRPDC